MRNCSHGGAGANTVGDTDGFGTDRRRAVTVESVAAVGDGAGPLQLEGHHTSQRPGIPASAAFAALVAAPVAVHPDGSTETAIFQHVYMMPATEVQERRWVGDIESSTPSIQAELAAGTEPEYHHPVQESDSAPGTAG